MVDREEGYIGMVGEDVVLVGHLFNVRIHLANFDGTARCVGVDLRAFKSAAESTTDLTDAQPFTDALLPIHGDVSTGWAEIDTKVYRALRLAEIVESARRWSRDLAFWVRSGGQPGRAVAYFVENPPHTHPEATALERALGDRDGPKRGAPTRYTADVLSRVVEPAWVSGHPGRVEAVRQALEAHFGERTTLDQAKKAIAKARATDPPLIPRISKGKP